MQDFAYFSGLLKGALMTIGSRVAGLDAEQRAHIRQAAKADIAWAYRETEAKERREKRAGIAPAEEGEILDA